MNCACHTITHRQSTRISLLQIFFDAYCHADGRVPVCNGCEHWQRTPYNNCVCTHPEHPENRRPQ